MPWKTGLSFFENPGGLTPHFQSYLVKFVFLQGSLPYLAGAEKNIMQEYIYNKEELQQLAEERKYSELRERITHLNEVDVADLITDLPLEQQFVVFSLAEKETAADVFANLPVESQKELISSLSDKQLTNILVDLSIDDMVDMIGELPANMVKRILLHSDQKTRRLVNKFLRYPDDSAGSIMTAEFIDLKKEMTVRQAIDRIKQQAEEMETIYTLYVTDKRRRLEGILSFRELIIADESKEIGSIMERDVISVSTTDDQERCAEIFNKYHFLSLPVVDNEQRLVGIVTVDDAVDVMEDEATEDFERMAALQPSEKPYLKTDVFELARNRIVWLLVLMVSGMVTGIILSRFQQAFVLVPVLVTFIPMLTDTGGNAGSQSSTLTIRGMAVGEVELKDFFKVIWKEFRVSLIVGLILATVNFIRIIVLTPGHPFMVAFTVSLAMMCTITLAKCLGVCMPMLAKRLKLDPAMMASPIITTLVDATSLVIFFNLARILLHLN